MNGVTVFGAIYPFSICHTVRSSQGEGLGKVDRWYQKPTFCKPPSSFHSANGVGIGRHRERETMFQRWIEVGPYPWPGHRAGKDTMIAQQRRTVWSLLEQKPEQPQYATLGSWTQRGARSVHNNQFSTGKEVLICCSCRLPQCKSPHYDQFETSNMTSQNRELEKGVQ